MPRIQVPGRLIVACAAVATMLVVLAGQWWPVWQLQMTSSDLATAVLDGLVGVSLLLTGAYLLTTAEQRSNGALIVVAGGLWLLVVVQWDLGPAAFITWVITPVPVAVLAVVMLRYPASRLAGPALRRGAALLVTWLVGGRVLDALLWDPRWNGSFGTWWPTVYHDPASYTIAVRVYHVGNIALALGFLLLTGLRLRRVTGLMRLRVWPIAVLAPCAGLAFGLASASWLATFDGGVLRVLALMTDGVLLMIPAAFAVAALQHAFERNRVADLVSGVAHAGTPQQIRSALRAALAEPGLELAFQLPESGDWVDAEGQQVTLEGIDRDHLVVPLAAPDGQTLAVVISDAAVAAHHDVLDPALVAVRMSLDNLRLQAVALARLQEVQQSRRRLMVAAVEERRRVERDLHDGAQQRLLAVSASLSRARARATDPASLAVLDDARDNLRVALQDLRELAAGLHPAVLSQAGLAAALGSVTDRLPLGVRTEVEARRWPADIEVAAYFVICECLTNVVKHSGAASATVRASQRGSCLMLCVEDDGAGGASAAPGRGLAGLSDRVAALGGTLRIESPAGSGTRIEAAFPCA